MKVKLHPKIHFRLQNIPDAWHSGFASQRIYGYALSQEPLRHITRGCFSQTERIPG